jgi:hypothetical protein
MEEALTMCPLRGFWKTMLTYYHILRRKSQQRIKRLKENSPCKGKAIAR